MLTWLLRHTRPVLGPLVWSTLCRILDHLLGIGVIGLTGWLLVWAAERAAQGEGVPGSSVWQIVGIIVLMCLVKAFLHYGEQFLGHLVAFKALELLRTTLFRELIPRSPAIVARRDAHGSGDVLSRATADIDGIEVFFAHSIAPLISSVVVPILTLIGVGVLASPRMAIVAGIVLLIVWVLILLVGWRSASRAAGASLSARGAQGQTLTDTVQGVREILGYGAEERQWTEIRAHRREGRTPAARLTGILAGRRALMILGHTLSVIIPLLSLRGAEGLSAAGVVASALALWRLWEIIEGVEACATSLHTALGGARRVYELTHEEPAVTAGGEEWQPERAPDVTWENVSFEAPRLDGFSLDARSGEWTTIVGRTGSGKSTALNLLLRYWDADDGRVLLDGCDIRDFRPQSLYENIGVVPQHAAVLTGTIRENLQLGAPQASEEDMWHALDDACLTEEITAMGGLDTPVGEAGAALSGGQLQRLVIAAMLLKKPQLIVLDESTSHLNPELARDVRTRVRARFPRATVIEVSHTLAPDDPLVDHRVECDQGRIRQSH